MLILYCNIHFIFADNCRYFHYFSSARQLFRSSVFILAWDLIRGITSYVLEDMLSTNRSFHVQFMKLTFPGWAVIQEVLLFPVSWQNYYLHSLLDPLQLHSLSILQLHCASSIWIYNLVGSHVKVGHTLDNHIELHFSFLNVCEGSFDFLTNTNRTSRA